MANPIATHLKNFMGGIIERSQHPKDPKEGEMYVHTTSNVLHIYDATNSVWWGKKFTTTTSISTSTTTTSTSQTTTSTSLSTTSSHSTSSSTSTTTTL